MISLMFSVFDRKAKTFSVPFFSQRRELAIRSVASMVSDVSAQASMLARFPEDFALFQLGSFDDESAKLELLGIPELVCNAVDLKRPADA